MKKSTFALLGAFALCIAPLDAFDRDYGPIQNRQLSGDGEQFLFRDVFGNEFKTVLNPRVARNGYKKDSFVHKGVDVRYKGDKKYRSRMGVDISRHDGEIDWKKLKKSGIEFVILRAGYRGYQSGILKVDERFSENIQGALAAGLDVGIYVFSQAANEAEALEEAELCLRAVEGHAIALPIFYDPEIIRDDSARSDDISGEQFTKNAVAFCEAVRNAGYTPGIYSNMLWEAYEFDLSLFDDCAIWFADYESVPQSPYRFEFWQYAAAKDGELNAPYDMDIQLLPTGK